MHAEGKEYLGAVTTYAQTPNGSAHFCFISPRSRERSDTRSSK